MIEIPLSNSDLKALIDDQDFERVKEIKWCLEIDGAAAGWCKKTKKKVLMHRLIMSAGPGVEVDHRNHSRLDNQKYNLRIGTKAQNGYNARKEPNTLSRFKGVSWHKKAGKWYAYIGGGKLSKRKHLGMFDAEEDAAMAYNDAAAERYGEWACLNKINLDFRLRKHIEVEFREPDIATDRRSAV